MRKLTTLLKLGAMAVAGTTATSALAGLTVINDPYSTGTADWLADVRFRNFRDTGGEINGTYEMSVNANPTRAFLTGDPLLTTGNLPGGYSAQWAENNQFIITYNPSMPASVSLRLIGSGRTSYDVTISRAPDAVSGPVNYIELSLWDRDAFATLPGGLTISDLDGTNLGNFALASAGIDSWAIVDPGGATLNNGFVLQGSFTVDPAKLLGGTETDKIVFGIGNHSLVPVPEPSTYIAGALLGLPLLAGGYRRLRRQQMTAKP